MSDLKIKAWTGASMFNHQDLLDDFAAFSAAYTAYINAVNNGTVLELAAARGGYADLNTRLSAEDVAILAKVAKIPAVCTDANTLNTAGDSGFYNIGAGCLNVPTASGTLLHIGRDGRPTQKYVDYLTGFEYGRVNNGSWQPWKQVMTTDMSTLAIKATVVTGSLTTFAQGCADGLTPFRTGAGVTTPSSNGAVDYSQGYVIAGGSGTYFNIFIFSRVTGAMYTNVYANSAWLGWKTATVVAAT